MKGCSEKTTILTFFQALPNYCAHQISNFSDPFSRFLPRTSQKWIFTFKKDHSALCSRTKIDCDKRRKVFLIRTFFYQRPLLRWAIWGERRLEFQPQLFQQKLPLNIFSRLLKHICESFPRLWTSPSKLLRYILDIHVPYHLTPLCLYFHVQAAQENMLLWFSITILILVVPIVCVVPSNIILGPISWD